MTREELVKRAREIWQRARWSTIPLNNDERAIMLDAYWSSVLPSDPDFNLGQWVEDGFPVIV